MAGKRRGGGGGIGTVAKAIEAQHPGELESRESYCR